MRTKNSVLTFLKNLGKDVNSKFPDINAGGCGAYALVLNKNLKRFGYDSDIKVAGFASEIDEYWDEDLSNLSLKKLRRFGYSHVFLNLYYRNSVYQVDSNTVKRISNIYFQRDPHLNLPVHASVLNPSMFEKIALQKFPGTTWNYHFNRLEIPILVNFVVEAFSNFFEKETK